MSTKKKFSGLEKLEKRFGKMNLGLFLRAFRESESISQTEFAKKLCLSRANLCDIEMQRKFVSPERAAKFAQILGVPESGLIQLALQDMLRTANLNYTIELKKVS